MGKIVYLDEKRNLGFETFMRKNRSQIYANTPKGNSISQDDEWLKETEWDELFQELSAKES